MDNTELIMHMKAVSEIGMSWEIRDTKDEDLPLLINRKWLNSEIEKEYVERLTKALYV